MSRRLIKSFRRFMEQTKGTYIGARFDVPSVSQLVKLQNLIGVRNPVPPDKFHVTVLYSRNPITVELKDYFYKALPTKIESWDTNDGTAACVLHLECPELVARHNELITQGGTHDYPDYKVHVTLSYDHKVKNPIPVGAMHLNITNEYYEPLDLKWVSNKL